jgi:acetoin utilization protein AcuC
MPKKVIIIHSPEYTNWFFSDDHPTQGRRFINGFNAISKSNVIFSDQQIFEPRLATDSELSRVHSEGYINQVTKEHLSGEWRGPREDLARFATLFAGGTLVALNSLLDGSAELAIHLPGAKHHSQYDHSSGFCVFNDFALAADIATKDHCLKVAIIDIDAHHGDGVENLTRENLDVLTFSIHEQGIFPGTGLNNEEEKNVYNFPLQAGKIGLGDSALLEGINTFIPIARAFDPDILFITSGADGLANDPLTHLEYTVEGYRAAATLLANSFPSLPKLMGGAGGYLPDDGTPMVWAAVACELSQHMKKEGEK